MIDLSEIRRVLAQATPGPWAATYGPGEDAMVWADDTDAEPLAVFAGYTADAYGQADAELVVLLRNQAQALCDELEAARVEIQNLRNHGTAMAKQVRALANGACP